MFWREFNNFGKLIARKHRAFFTTLVIRIFCVCGRMVKEYNYYKIIIAILQNNEQTTNGERCYL